MYQSDVVNFINPHTMKFIEEKNEVVTTTTTDANGQTETVKKRIWAFALLWGFIRIEIVREYSKNVTNE